MSDAHERIVDLLLERAAAGLSVADEAELAELLEREGFVDDGDFELAVAAAWSAFALAETESAAAPASLQAKLQADADAFFGPADNVASMGEARARKATPARAPFLNRLGWAAAAMLAIALIFSLQPPAIPDAATARAVLLQDAQGTTIVEWSPPQFTEYRDVSGDVVWNDARQEGYLRLVGMPVNDPAESQYQLWIVDSDRDAEPVDGGVFDIAAGGEVVIPIDAKLAVSDPEAFAITREKPGGVVVSDGPLLIVAAAG